MTSDAQVLVEDSKGTRLLTLNRPAQLNAWDNGLFAALEPALREAQEDDAVKVVVLTGAGRAFSAGADLSRMSLTGTPEGDADAAEQIVLSRALAARLQSFAKPLIAAVNGVAVGFGCTILGHCDIVLVARSARLRMPFAPLGLSPEAGSSTLLPALVGWQRAARILFVGDWITADQAVEWGLALEVHDDGELLAEAMALAALIGQGSVESLTATKQLLLATRAEDVAAAREREWPVLAALRGSPANLAALAAFATRATKQL